MARVFISPELRELTGGLSLVEATGSTVRQVIDSLETDFPGIAAHLVLDDRIRPGLSVVIDSTVASRGLRAEVRPNSEVQFLPSISGG